MSIRFVLQSVPALPNSLKNPFYSNRPPDNGVSDEAANLSSPARTSILIIIKFEATNGRVVAVDFDSSLRGRVAKG